MTVRFICVDADRGSLFFLVLSNITFYNILQFVSLLINLHLGYLGAIMGKKYYEHSHTGLSLYGQMFYF